MPTTAYAITVTPPVAKGFYDPIEVRFEHAAAPGAEPNPNPAYLVRDGSTALMGRQRITEATTFYFPAATAVNVVLWLEGDDVDRRSGVVPAAYATPTNVTVGPTSSGTIGAELSSQFGPLGPVLKSRQVPAIDPAQAYVAIIFDDGHNTVYNTAWPLMRARGMVGTLAITTDLVGTANYMTWAQIREMEADGWEIASHSKSHANLVTATDAEETDEIELSKAALLANGVQRVRGFVAPYGLYNADTLTKVKKHYEWQRFNGEDATYPQLWNIDRWNLTAYNPGSSLDRFKAKIDRSIYNGIWCSPLFHYIDRTGAGGNSYDTDDFIEFLDYIVSRRVAVGTYSDRLLASTAAQEYAEVAYNGNFADGSGGIPHAWTRSAGTCVWSLSGGDPLFPTIPVVDVPTSSDLLDGDPTYWAPVTAGDTYVLSQTMRADLTSSAGVAGYLFITWYQSNKSSVISNSQDFAITLPTTAYRSFSLEATAPALAAFCRIRLRSGTSTRCLVANVSFRKKRA